MAKSLRSKWKRKCRAIKRERYAVKELDRLKKTLGIDNDNVSKDIEMTEITEIATGTIHTSALIIVYLNSYLFFIIVYIIM